MRGRAREELDFGPAFQGLAQAVRVSDDLIEVQLTDAAGDPRYGLDPARLNSCFHGLILLFGARDGEGGAYLPVRFGEARLFLPNADIASAKIQLRRFDDQILVADFELFDRQARPAAKNQRRALPGGPTARVGQAFRSRPRPALDRRRHRPRGRPASRSPADPR